MNTLDRSLLNKALLEAPFNASDRALVRYLSKEYDESNNWVLFSAALANLAIRQGHSYLDLNQSQDFQRSLLRFSHTWPEIQEWEAWSQDSRVLSGPTRPTPLVFDAPCGIYLRKYFNHETRLSQLLMNRLSENAPDPNASLIQRALSQHFFVITGGPGTGKTTLALKYLTAFLGNWEDALPPRIAAIAPTGKAAARLEESIRYGIEKLEATKERKAFLAETPTLTIHRLLGTQANRASFRRHQYSPIDFDLLVIDECSMIDLPLMRRLLEAIPQECRTLLLGDRDQLSSVEVGSVFTDILLSAEAPQSPFADKVHYLTKTYRFSEDSSIYQACQAARTGDSDSLQSLMTAKTPDFRFQAIAETAKRLPKELIKKGLARHKALSSCATANEALAELSKSIILSTTRVGPFGATAINREIESKIAPQIESSLFHACPIIVLENNYELELFNGDLGIIWADKEGRLEAWFTTVDRSEKRVSVNNLPKHETAFGLTIHKSQGSEFDETITLISPQDSDLLSRELIYTAFSRAKTKLEVFANPEILASAIQRKVQRATRLAERLVKP